MAVRITGTNSYTASPTNQALTKIAQARVESEVSRAVKRHENALKVDGFDIYLWRRGTGGLICTCRQPATPLQTKAVISYSPEALREPGFIEPNTLPIASQNPGTIAFQIVPRIGLKEDDRLNVTPYDELEMSAYQNNLDDQNVQNKFNSLTTLETEQDDAVLATMLSEGAAIYGGDKTACGICFGTGRTHGYELATGKRLLLDASGEYPFSLSGASIQNDQFPTKFVVTSNSFVSWQVDLPAYTKNWLNFTIRDNLMPATGLVLEWFYTNSWVPLTVMDLAKTEGRDRSNIQIRVRLADANQLSQVTFTHVEIIYSTIPPLLGQTSPLNYMTDYEASDPRITTEFEILANIDDIPRESVFQDSKFKYLWKVVDVSPKMTTQGQIFSLTLNARRVQRTEAIYALKVIFDPLVVVNYRGLELEEGGLPYDTVNADQFDQDTIKFTIGN